MKGRGDEDGKAAKRAVSSSVASVGRVVHITRDADADDVDAGLLQCGDVGILIENAGTRSRYPLLCPRPYAAKSLLASSLIHSWFINER